MSQETRMQQMEDVPPTSRRSNAFIAVTDPSRYRIPEGAPAPIVGDYDQRRDNIRAALENGTAEVKDQTGRHVGWSNTREDLLLDVEHRILMNILNHDPSREEVLANMIRRECKDLSPEAQFELAKMDKNIRPEIIRGMLIPEEPAVEEEAPEPPQARKPLIVKNPERPSRAAAVKQAVEETHDMVYRKAQDSGITLPWADNTVSVPSGAAEKLVTMTCPIGRYQMPVTDVVVEEAYAVIIQREDASFLFLPERDRKRYSLDICPFPMEYSGVSFSYDGQRFTLMILKK